MCKMLNGECKFPIVGNELLARWTDGLFYTAKVKKIDEASGKCLLLFDDNSEFWVLINNIESDCSVPRLPMYGDLRECSVCHDKTDTVHNRLFTCMECQIVIHKDCETTPNAVRSKVSFYDWKCSFCSQKQNLPPSRNGLTADAINLKMDGIKVEAEHHTYEMRNLTWDSQHKTNTQKKYCYCGQNGLWYKKMIQCLKCKMWYHETCITCLQHPILYGDRFYMFLCSMCGSGQEFIQRLLPKWVDIVHLAIFNLTVEKRKKFFDVNSVIIPWIRTHWEWLQIKDMPELPNDIIDLVMEELQNDKRFQCGKEVGKGANVWSLKVRVPPPPPPRIHFSELKKNNNIQRPQKRKAEEKLQELESAQQKRRKIAAPKSNGRYCIYPSLMRQQYDCASVSSLDSFIPPLEDYEEERHPFRTQLECKQAIENKQRKKHLLTTYSMMHTQHNGYTASRPADRLTQMYNPDSDSDMEEYSNACNSTSKVLQRVVDRIRRKRGKKTEKELELLQAAEQLARNNGINLRSCPKFVHPPKDVLSKNALDGLSGQTVSANELRSTVCNYFGAAERLNNGEQFSVQGKRVLSDGRVQYLIEWESRT